jgi:hypothetical protein
MDAIFARAEEAEAGRAGRCTVESASMSGDERRKLTLEAERRGWVVFKELDEAKRKPHLVITRSRNEACDPEHMTPAQLEVLSNLCNVPLSDPATVLTDLALFGVDDAEQLVTDCVDELRRYGTTGLKRRDRILQEEMKDHLSAQPEYKAFQQGAVPVLVGAVDPSMTIKQVVYQAANKDKLFFSIDLKSAIFHCYRELGICKDADSWATWVARFTPSKTFARNKFVRVRLFGGLDKARTHVTLWQNKIWVVYQGRILPAWPEAAERRVAIEGDEIVLATTPETLIADARLLLDKAGLAEQAAYINVRCYRLLPLTVDVSAEDKPRNSHTINCFMRQDMDLATGQPSGAYDVKCVQGPFRKRAMLAAHADLAHQ